MTPVVNAPPRVRSVGVDDVLAVLAVIVLATGDLLFVGADLSTRRLNLGFTENNAVYVLAKGALVPTALIVAGAVTLGRRGLLVVAAALTGLYLVLVLGMAGVQVVLGARFEFLPETGALLTSVLLLGGAVVVGWRALRSPPLAWVAALLCLAGALVWDLGSLLVNVVFREATYDAGLPLALAQTAGAVVAAVTAASLAGTPHRGARIAAAIPLGILIGLALVTRFWEYPQPWVSVATGRVGCLAVAAALAVGAGLVLPRTRSGRAF